MTTMTIHAEDDFAVALRAYARSFGKSVNQTVKDVFAPILGLSEPAAENLWVRFYGAGAKVDGRVWKRDLANMRRGFFGDRFFGDRPQKDCP